MGRPASADPNVALTIRLPKSVIDRWEESAKRKGLPNARSLIEQKLIDATK